MLRVLARSTALAVAACLTGGQYAAAEPQHKEVEVNNVTMRFVEEGAGEPVVFIHGAVSDLRSWDGIREAIADERRFIAPTLRYFGTGEWPDKGENFSTTNHADDVATFVRNLDIGPVHLVGWSYGANVATAAALQHPDIIQSLVLYEPSLRSLIKEGDAGQGAGEAAGKMFGPVAEALKMGDAEKATKLLIEGVFQMEPGSYDSQPVELKSVQLENARTMPLLFSAPPWDVTCEELNALDKPVLIVHGSDSNAFWTHIAQQMTDCLPQAKLEILAGVTHNGPVRDPAGLARMVENFIAEQ